MGRLLPLCLLLLLLAPASAAAAGLRQSPEAELRVCTQNINRVGAEAKGKAGKKGGKDIGELVERFAAAGCGAIALQEVPGSNIKQAMSSLERIVHHLSQRTGRRFIPVVGASRDNFIRNGFLIDPSAASVKQMLSFSQQHLPKLQARSSYHRFTRGPLAVVLEVPGRGGASGREVFLLNTHFKSKANSWKDPSGTEFETLRLEMAEAVRNLAEGARRELGSEGVVVVLGDFNSRDDSASFDVLTGRRLLKDFQLPGLCAIDKGLRSSCPSAVRAHRRLLAPLFAHDGAHIAQRVSSFRYRRQQLLIDNVLVFDDQRWMTHDGEHPASGAAGRFGEGSDHKLLWADINW